MNIRISVITGIALGILGTSVAEANWLDDAWSDASARANGNPAITIRADSVHVVLPVATLDQAYEAGVATEDAVRDFLERYGPHCSDLIDLNLPHRSLKIGLSLQSQQPLENIDTREELLMALKNTRAQFKTDDDFAALFVTSSVKFEFLVDYLPKHRVTCVDPKEYDPTS